MIKEKYIVGLLISMQIAGIIGFIYLPNWFVPLTSFNLLFSAYLVLHEPIIKKELHFSTVGLIALFGFIIEWLGVQSGLLFGEYKYGSAFGFKIGGVPLLIGLNWAILLICSASMFTKITNHKLYLPMLVASTMTLIDFFIEQVAMRFDFWYWKDLQIPVQNYIAWFTVSFLLAFIFKNKIQLNNFKIPRLYLGLQLLFFISLLIQQNLN